MRFLGKITKIISSTNIAYPKSFVCLFFSLSPLLPLFFFTELRVKRSKTEQSRKSVIIKHRVFASFSFLHVLDLCDTSIQVTLNLVPEKSSHNIFNCHLYWRDNSIQGKRALFLGLKLKFNLHSIRGNAKRDWPQRGLITCKLITRMSAFHKLDCMSMYCTCGNSKNDIEEISWSWFFYTLNDCSQKHITLCFCCSSFWGRMKYIYKYKYCFFVNY